MEAHHISAEHMICFCFCDAAARGWTTLALHSVTVGAPVLFVRFLFTHAFVHGWLAVEGHPLIASFSLSSVFALLLLHVLLQEIH